MPRQHAAVVRRIIRELDVARNVPIDAYRHGAWKPIFIGHRVRVWVEARLECAAASHEITLDLVAVVAVLAEELLRRDL